MGRRYLSVVGARPQFVKIAPLCREFTRGDHADVEHVIVHTGQHYDPGMSDVFFEELQIPRADIDLKVGSGPHGQQTGRMLEKIETLLAETEVDLVIVYGDTNSTLAGTLAAVKCHVPVAHVESGLRSFNRAMPEEINRVVADHTADLLLAPTRTAMGNLRREGLAKRTVYTGDIMRDATVFNRDLARAKSCVLQRLGLNRESYGVVTVHRAENTDGEHLEELLDALNGVAGGALPLVFPVHPRTRKRLQSHNPRWRAVPQLMLTDPMSYLDMLRLVDGCKLVLTDSGGLQKEAMFLDRPCVTLRTETEWLETLDGGANVLVGHSRKAIETAVSGLLEIYADHQPDFGATADEQFGAGNAAGETAQALRQFVDSIADGEKRWSM